MASGRATARFRQPVETRLLCFPLQLPCQSRKSTRFTIDLGLGFNRPNPFMGKKARIGVINVSDRASKGIYEDIPGKACVDLLNEWLITPFDVEYAVVPDEQEQIENELKRFSDDASCSLIVTTGGTGPAVRDITPEATANVCQKMLPGFGEEMRQASLKYVPTAILSRQTAGIRGSCLIVNLPGKPKAIRENLEAVFPAIPYCIDLIGGDFLETDESVMKAFRPNK